MSPTHTEAITAFQAELANNRARLLLLRNTLAAFAANTTGVDPAVPTVAHTKEIMKLTARVSILQATLTILSAQ